MFEATDIREWRGHYVMDAEGRKIGQLEAIYVDTSTDRPAFIHWERSSAVSVM